MQELNELLAQKEKGIRELAKHLSALITAENSKSAVRDIIFFRLSEAYQNGLQDGITRGIDMLRLSNNTKR